MNFTLNYEKDEEILTGAHPAPQLTTPTRSCWFVELFLTVSGPPLSPWQEPFPGAPAQTISLEIKSLLLQGIFIHFPNNGT